ncbi:hypothetical protein H5410_000590 [Solanum commersonii]|uniref:Leucine-rich repeat-containing N-terminal plant-type domain-containing protein n=1 Tax=Solanum commersonii TaxID=4109 RepID=A0A9J6AWX6_SOLCO|nr:hypothetical protein H5410_000590 [Solanum commersonii]
MGYVNLVFFMLFPFLCHLSFSSSLPHLCPKHQALALLQFRHMFTISPVAFDSCFAITGQWIQSYPKTLSWNKSTDCCSWDGVYCDETTGEVIELNLTCCQLQGKFHSNSSLFQLSNLKRLYLSNNNFSGSLISPKFGEFSSLTQLDLSYSSFTGIIPAEISRLSKLHVFRIQSYSDGLRFKPHNFELLLKNLTQLRELDFDNVNISSTIPLNFSSYLTTLHLRNTQLYGTLPEGVFHLYNLESLYLIDNPQLTVKFPTTKWNSSASLMELYLYSVNATGRIPESFGHLTSLRTLRIASCNLSGSIPKPLWNLTNIEELNLDYNHLEGPISDFFRFGKLKSLSLGNNNFDGQFEFLDFSSNLLTGPIPSNVSGMQNLQSLYLSSNHLNGTIPSWIFSLPSLWHLELSDNHFSGNIQEFKSKTLHGVSLKQNQLQDCGGDDGVPQATSQVELDQEGGDSPMINWQEVLMGYGCGLVIVLSSNPYEIRFGPHNFELLLKNLTQLRELDLNILSTIPLNFSSYLTTLQLPYTQLRGILPERVFHLSNLKFLHLSSNPQLTVRFPMTKWNSSASLMRLYLSGVNFTGRIPESLSQLTSLLLLVMSYSNLSGPIPRPLWKLTNIEILMFGNNNLEGPISQLLRFGKLRGFSLRNNNFNGQLEFLSFNRSWTQLATLDFSSNSLTGPIPSNISRLQTLQSFNLSSNYLNGIIPS